MIRLLLALAAASPIAAPTAAEPPLRLRDAQAMVAQAERTALAQKIPMSIVVVNQEGRVILAERMDGAAFQSVEVAQSKATTAGSLGIPTIEVEKAIAGGATNLLSLHGLVALAGGVPVFRDGQLIGGIGASGGSDEQDAAVAGAGAAALPKQ